MNVQLVFFSFCFFFVRCPFCKKIKINSSYPRLGGLVWPNENGTDLRPPTWSFLQVILFRSLTKLCALTSKNGLLYSPTISINYYIHIHIPLINPSYLGLKNWNTNGAHGFITNHGTQTHLPRHSQHI